MSANSRRFSSVLWSVMAGDMSVDKGGEEGQVGKKGGGMRGDENGWSTTPTLRL